MTLESDKNNPSLNLFAKITIAVVVFAVISFVVLQIILTIVTKHQDDTRLKDITTISNELKKAITVNNSYRYSPDSLNDLPDDQINKSLNMIKWDTDHINSENRFAFGFPNPANAGKFYRLVGSSGLDNNESKTIKEGHFDNPAPNHVKSITANEIIILKSAKCFRNQNDNDGVNPAISSESDWRMVIIYKLKTDKHQKCIDVVK